MPKKNVRSIDVSGDTDERGRVINRDVPEEARRGGGVKKKKRPDRTKAKSEITFDENPAKPKKKRRKVDEEEVLPKKKKKSKKLDLEEEPKKRKKKERAIDGPATSKQLARMERRKEKLQNEIQFLPASGGSNDEFDQQYRGMFEKLRTITELFETKMLDNPNGRDVYALSTLYSQMREVIADIRSAKDVTEQIAELEAKAYGAFLKLIGQSYVDLFFKISKDIRVFVKDSEAQAQLISSLEGIVKDESNKVQGGYGVMLDRVRTVLT